MVVLVCDTGEWISGAVCMFIANHLATHYGKDEEVSCGADCLYIALF